MKRKRTDTSVQMRMDKYFTTKVTNAAESEQSNAAFPSSDPSTSKTVELESTVVSQTTEISSTLSTAASLPNENVELFTNSVDSRMYHTIFIFVS